MGRRQPPTSPGDSSHPVSTPTLGLCGLPPAEATPSYFSALSACHLWPQQTTTHVGKSRARQPPSCCTSHPWSGACDVADVVWGTPMLSQSSGRGSAYSAPIRLLATHGVDLARALGFSLAAMGMLGGAGGSEPGEGRSLLFNLPPRLHPSPGHSIRAAAGLGASDGDWKDRIRRAPTGHLHTHTQRLLFIQCLLTCAPLQPALQHETRPSHPFSPGLPLGGKLETDGKQGYRERGRAQGRPSAPPHGGRRNFRERPGVRQTFRFFPS